MPGIGKERISFLFTSYVSFFLVRNKLTELAARLAAAVAKHPSPSSVSHSEVEDSTRVTVMKLVYIVSSILKINCIFVFLFVRY